MFWHILTGSHVSSVKFTPDLISDDNCSGIEISWYNLLKKVLAFVLWRAQQYEVTYFHVLLCNPSWLSRANRSGKLSYLKEGCNLLVMVQSFVCAHDQSLADECQLTACRSSNRSCTLCRSLRQSPTVHPHKSVFCLIPPRWTTTEENANLWQGIVSHNCDLCQTKGVLVTMCARDPLSVRTLDPRKCPLSTVLFSPIYVILQLAVAR